MKGTEINVLLKEIKTTANDSKQGLFIEKHIILVAKLHFSIIYKRRLYENIFLSLVQLCLNECCPKPLQLCRSKFPEGSSIFE